jgi:hypothetical protein
MSEATASARVKVCRIIVLGVMGLVTGFGLGVMAWTLLSL